MKKKRRKDTYSKRKVKTVVSECCGTYVYVAGKTTHYYVCTSCEQACDVVQA